MVALPLVSMMGIKHCAFVCVVGGDSWVLDVGVLGYWEIMELGVLGCWGWS